MRDCSAIFRQPHELLRFSRKEKGLTIKKAALPLGLSRSYLSEIELGTKQPSDEVLYKLSNFYNIDLTFLFVLYNRTPPQVLSFFADTDIPIEEKLATISSIQEHLEQDKLYRISDNKGSILANKTKQKSPLK